MRCVQDPVEAPRVCFQRRRRVVDMLQASAADPIPIRYRGGVQKWKRARLSPRESLLPHVPRGAGRSKVR
jgi:hypothetical protein